MRRIRMLKTAAGPTQVLPIGSVQSVEESFGRMLVDANAAVWVDLPSTKPAAAPESATIAQPETAVTPPASARSARRR